MYLRSSLGLALPLAASQPISFLTYLYLSSTTFFTLGLAMLPPFQVWDASWSCARPHWATFFWP